MGTFPRKRRPAPQPGLGINPPKPGIGPQRPAAGRSAVPPGQPPPAAGPRKPPTVGELRAIVGQAAAKRGPILCASIAAVDELLDTIAADLAARLQGCTPPAKLEKRKPRLPDGAEYVKLWDGKNWTVTLGVPVPGDKTAVFEVVEPASFAGEVKADDMYRKWLQENYGE